MIQDARTEHVVIVVYDIVFSRIFQNTIVQWAKMVIVFLGSGEH